VCLLTVTTRSTIDRPESAAQKRPPRVALVLGGGAARGLAHIGVLEVFEREGIPLDSIVGTSMGGLVGALSATGLDAKEVAEVARDFHFPRLFLPGAMLRWSSLFASAVPVLSGTFEQLETPLAVTAVDVETGAQVVLHTGPILPAVQATCTVPGILPPVKVGDRWLVDGGLVNVLPVDVAWMSDAEVVVAVKVGAVGKRQIPELNWRVNTLLSRLGSLIPNPATAKVTLELLFRAVEIMLDRQTTLAVAMTGPELLIEPELGGMGLRDFHELEGAIDAGRRAAEAALPELAGLLDSAPTVPATGERVLSLRFDPVCAMVINPNRARAKVTRGDKTYYFCSENCRDRFERDPDAYLDLKQLHLGGEAPQKRPDPEPSSSTDRWSRIEK
jgi:NTE family protein